MNKRRFFAGFAAAAIAASMMAVPVSAESGTTPAPSSETYEPVGGESWTFDKILTLGTDDLVPPVTFEWEIEEIEADIPATAETAAVYKGAHTDFIVGTADFSPTDIKDASADSRAEGAEATVTKTLTLTL